MSGVRTLKVAERKTAVVAQETKEGLEVRANLVQTGRSEKTPAILELQASFSGNDMVLRTLTVAKGCALPEQPRWANHLLGQRALHDLPQLLAFGEPAEGVGDEHGEARLLLEGVEAALALRASPLGEPMGPQTVAEWIDIGVKW